MHHPQTHQVLGMIDDALSTNKAMPPTGSTEGNLSCYFVNITTVCVLLEYLVHYILKQNRPCFEK